MSIRHRVRKEVEELLKLTVEDPSFPREEETVLYVVLVPEGELLSEEDMEVYEHEVDLEEKETVKRFLSGATREILEGDVKGLKLYGFAFDSEEGIKVVAKDPKKEINDMVVERINRMKEAV